MVQIAELLGKGGSASADMHAAMGPDGSDWAHPDSLTCDACHTSYNLFCIGCHVSVDMRLEQVDLQTGLPTPGLVRGSRDTYSLDHVLLGMAPDGRVQSVMPSQQVQMAVIDTDGEVVLGEWKLDEKGQSTGKTLGVHRDSSFGHANSGFHTFFQHTTTDEPRTCEVCHRSDDSAAELARVRGVYGFGTGEFMLDDPEGEPVDALQFLDADGNQLTDWVHDGSGPLPEDRRDRAIGVILSEL